MDTESTQFPPASPASYGLRGRCPRCGEGRLFQGYLGIRPRCGVCGLDYGFADSADGPAVFVILVVGFLAVGVALWLEVSYSPPLWLHLVIVIPLALVLCLVPLRLLKGVLINLQYANKAAEGRLDRGR